MVGSTVPFIVLVLELSLEVEVDLRKPLPECVCAVGFFDFLLLKSPIVCVMIGR